MASLTIEGNKSYLKQKSCHKCKNEFSTDDNDKKIL